MTIRFAIGAERKWRRNMTIEQAIELIRKSYPENEKLEYVEDPVAYTLYHAWKIVDELHNEKKGIKIRVKCSEELVDELREAIK